MLIIPICQIPFHLKALSREVPYLKKKEQSQRHPEIFPEEYRRKKVFNCGISLISVDSSQSKK